MNRFFIVALLATGIFTSCNNEDVQSNDDAQAISFRLQGGAPSVVTRATATTLANIEGFIVFGTDNVLALSNDLLFFGETVARQLDGTFSYAPKKYYSNGATNAGFFAYSPISAIISPYSWTSFLTSGASFEYSVPAPDLSGNTTQEDFLVAGTVVTPSTAAVSLNFEHALSRIFVSATNNTDDPVIIEKLTLVNLYTKGTLTIPPAAPWYWVPTGTKDDYNYILAETGVAVPGGTTTAKLVTSMEQGMMILPQVADNTADDVAAGDFALEVKYSFANLGSRTIHIYIPDGYEFEKNTQYNINIAFTGIAVNFDITISDFDTPIIDVNP